MPVEPQATVPTMTAARPAVPPSRPRSRFNAAHPSRGPDGPSDGTARPLVGSQGGGGLGAGGDRRGNGGQQVPRGEQGSEPGQQSDAGDHGQLDDAEGRGEAAPCPAAGYDAE